jgi:3-hydroxyacyl-CoA dehydrogenase
MTEGPVRLRFEDDIAVIVIDNPPVNAGSRAVREALLDRLGDLVGSAATGVVIIGAGRTFVAGSDIREFGAPLEEPQLPAVIAAIEALPIPVVAAIHGAALGGGFELALGCDARVASADAVVGLPEVKLGMVPGAGGTQRLVRLVNVAKAIDLVCSGQRVPAPEALALGLIDALADGDLLTAALAHARSLGTTKRRLGEAPVLSSSETEIAAAADKAMRRGRQRPNVVEAISLLRDANTAPFATMLARERAAFQQLRSSDEAAALRHLFFAEREAGRVDGLAGVAPLPIHTVGVVGAGTMGAGIAVCLLNAGLTVRLIEQDEPALARGIERIELTLAADVASGRCSTSQSASRRAALTGSIALAELRDCDLIIEAAFEDLAIKQDLFARLDAVARPDAILATNTSYLDIAAIAAATQRPASVIGLHFFSPANVMKLLEVVRTPKTSDQALLTGLKLARQIGKIAVVSALGEGFIGNRIYSAYRRQCEFMVEEGASPQQVDAALEAFGFAMGPFAVSDLSGLDIAWKTRQRLTATRDPRERYVTIPDRLCEAGRLGRKAGAGWYRYDERGQRHVDPAVATLIEANSAVAVRRAFHAEEIQRRALAAIVNEAKLVLQDGVAQRAGDIDVALVHGYGFPAWEGGPLYWHARQDRQQTAKALDEVERATGFGFRRAG